LFSMLSNHYGFTYGAKYNWLVLVAIMVAGALIRMSFALRHKAIAYGKPVPWRYAVWGTLLLVVVVFAIMPAQQPAQSADSAAVTFAQVQTVITQRCTLCHGAAMQSKNLRFDASDEIVKHAQQIYQQAVVLKTMPMNNATRITDAERALIGRWFTAGASPQ
jgi:uncharacterized membrane protein